MKNNRGNKKNTFTRLIKTLFEFYPVLLPVIIVLILFNSVVSSIPSVFMQNIIAFALQFTHCSHFSTGGKYNEKVTFGVPFLPFRDYRNR